MRPVMLSDLCLTDTTPNERRIANREDKYVSVSILLHNSKPKTKYFADVCRMHVSGLLGIIFLSALTAFSVTLSLTKVIFWDCEC